MKSFYYTAVLKSISTLIKTENKLDNVLYSWAYKKEFQSRLLTDYGHLKNFTFLFNRLWDQFTTANYKSDVLELLIRLNFKFNENSTILSTMCGTQEAVGPVSPIVSREHQYGRRINDSVEMHSRLTKNKIVLGNMSDPKVEEIVFNGIQGEFLDEFKSMLDENASHYTLRISETTKVSKVITDKINMVADEILKSTGVRGNVVWISPMHLLELSADAAYATTVPLGTLNHVGLLTDPLDETKNIKVYCDFTLKDDTILVGFKDDDYDSGIVFAPYMLYSVGVVSDSITQQRSLGLLARYAWWAGKDADRLNYYGVIDIVKPKEKIEYESEEFLSKLRTQLDDYIPNNLPDKIKPKRAETIIAEYGAPIDDNGTDIYDIQLRGTRTLNDIGVSHLLGSNDVVLEPLVKEYRELYEILSTLNSEYKRLNNFHELKEFVPKFKLSDIKTALFNDLQQLTETYDIECDIKELMKQYSEGV